MRSKGMWEAADGIRRLLLRLLIGITLLYFFLMAVELPYYYNTATDYSYIGSDKAGFFRKYALFCSKLFCPALVLWGLAELLCFFHAHWREKGFVLPALNKLMGKLSLTDWFAVFFAATLGLSCYCSDYGAEALWGTKGWYMGLLPQLICLGSYFAVSRLLPEGCLKWLLPIWLAAVLPVFILGIINRYNLWMPGMVPIAPQYISSIGNINWYCGYWVILFPAAPVFLLLSKPPHPSADAFVKTERMLRLFLAVVTCLMLAAGLTQGSDSGMAALAAFLFLITGLAVFSTQKERLSCLGELFLLFGVTIGILAVIQRIWPEQNTLQTPAYQCLIGTAWGVFPFVIFLLTIVSCFLLDRLASHWEKKWVRQTVRRAWLVICGFLVVTVASYIILLIKNTLRPGSIGAFSANGWFVFDNGWGNGRGATWRAGIFLFLEQDFVHKMVGVGPDSMAAYLYGNQVRPVLGEWIKQTFGSSRLTNAHNEWLTILANEGIIGLLSYAGMIISAVIRYIYTALAKKQASRTAVFCAACGVGLFTYTVNQMFSFQQTMTLTQVFLLMGVGERLWRQENAKTANEENG